LDQSKNFSTADNLDYLQYPIFLIGGVEIPISTNQKKRANKKMNRQERDELFKNMIAEIHRTCPYLTYGKLWHKLEDSIQSGRNISKMIEFEHIILVNTLILGIQLFLTGMYDAAIQIFELCHKVDLYCYISRWNITLCMVMQNKLEKALEEVEFLNDKKPGWVYGHLLAVWVKLKLGSLDNALRSLRTAEICVNPDSPEEKELLQALTKHYDAKKELKTLCRYLKIRVQTKKRTCVYLAHFTASIAYLNHEEMSRNSKNEWKEIQKQLLFHKIDPSSLRYVGKEFGMEVVDGIRDETSWEPFYILVSQSKTTENTHLFVAAYFSDANDDEIRLKELLSQEAERRDEDNSYLSSIQDALGGLFKVHSVHPISTLKNGSVKYCDLEWIDPMTSSQYYSEKMMDLEIDFGGDDCDERATTLLIDTPIQEQLGNSDVIEFK
jgi:tetratricopeptide (TPR) repeat protein